MKNQNKNQSGEGATVARRWKYACGAITLVLAAVLIYAFFPHSGAAPQASIDEAFKQYPLIDPARHLIGQEHYLSTIQPLRERIHALINAEKNLRISVYIEFLNTGSNIAANNDERFWPASLAKIPIAMAVIGTIESGVWTLEQPLTLEESDRSRPPSTLHDNPVGTKFTVDDLLEALLVHSDNTALQILVRNVPQSELDAVREGIGLENLFNENGEISAREYSRLFRSLYTASFLNRQNSQYLLEKLSRAEWKHFLAGSVPDSVPFPHKYGVEPEKHTYSDSGVVYVPNRPYLITVMIEGNGKEEEEVESEHAARVMNAISQAAYVFFTTARNREL